MIVIITRKKYGPHGFGQKWIDKFEPLLKEKMQNNDLNYFELRVNMYTGNIVFVDPKGKILAFVHFNEEKLKMKNTICRALHNHPQLTDLVGGTRKDSTK